MLEIYNKFCRCRKMIRIIKYKAARRPKIKKLYTRAKSKSELAYTVKFRRGNQGFGGANGVSSNGTR